MGEEEFRCFLMTICMKVFQKVWKEGRCPFCIFRGKINGEISCERCSLQIPEMVRDFEDIDTLIEGIYTNPDQYALFTNDEEFERPGAGAKLTPYFKLLILVKDYLQEIRNQLTLLDQITCLVKEMKINFLMKEKELSLFDNIEFVDLTLLSFLEKSSFYFKQSLFKEVIDIINLVLNENLALKETNDLLRTSKSSQFHQHFHLILRILGFIDYCPFIEWGRWTLDDLVKNDEILSAICARQSLEVIPAGYGITRRKFDCGDQFDVVQTTGEIHEFKKFEKIDAGSFLTKLKVDKLMSETEDKKRVSERKRSSDTPSGQCSLCEEEKLFLFPKACMDCLTK